MKKGEASLRGSWDNIKWTNIRITGFLEREEREKGAEILFEKLMAEFFLPWIILFPNLEKETDIQIQEAQKVLNKMNTKRPTTRHIVIIMLKVKDKERILNAAREKQFLCTREPS